MHLCQILIHIKVCLIEMTVVEFCKKIKTIFKSILADFKMAYEVRFFFSSTSSSRTSFRHVIHVFMFGALIPFFPASVKQRYIFIPGYMSSQHQHTTTDTYEENIVTIRKMQLSCLGLYTDNKYIDGAVGSVVYVARLSCFEPPLSGFTGVQSPVKVKL